MKGQDRDEWIAQRAYALWEQCGRLDGGDREHWMQAVRERDELERTQASADGREVLVRFRPKASTTTPRRRTAPAAAVAGG
ncbi:DUF2934 domain-containing protein [Rhizobium sp. P32RR-XVIII]|uniref:DUF2934 domain-containing protein n=1 Tax=Rhizobium sp. P32RR-XVIII TaxID=2726738 RepID=UPI00145711D7|nr:DUF2934 domain-containing protein [Rhizobium sp. P32RR-XVIII]NLS03693.1 DUF2934 domain-containing protein [Rhizobium sp. P32RR-XVIII]